MTLHVLIEKTIDRIHEKDEKHRNDGRYNLGKSGINEIESNT
eukprot:CAMPEP_0194325982 /NCGR_PEP_ID=MMETSP0171-20130528/34070_1 /TAXON_ID=218684 /ORGANISM="Corethron pennatum, Strain L29A3" /LENGTH=41 /DNA_ID= /DNA_START= /DNA_END= /DNA_ORIENTATION=